MPETKTVHWTWKELILKMDPEWDKEDRKRVEFEFSNGRKFEGEYKKRGAYADD